NPPGLRIEPGHPPSGFRVLHVAEPVPDQPADIKLVVEDAGAALAVAMDSAWPPRLAGWAGHAVGIEPFGNRARRDAGSVLLENTADDRGLARIDPAF